MSASALPGRRVDWYRAGMMAIAETGTRKEEGPVSETGGTANLTTAVRARRRPRSNTIHTDRVLSVFIGVDPWRKPRGRMTMQRISRHDCTQDRVLRRRRRAARRVSRGGEHAVAGRSRRASARPRPRPLPASAIASPPKCSAQASKLHARMAAGARLPTRNPRNPFAFGAPRAARAAPSAVRATVRRRGVPLEPPPPLPVLTLMGIAEETAADRSAPHRHHRRRRRHAASW